MVPVNNLGGTEYLRMLADYKFFFGFLKNIEKKSLYNVRKPSPDVVEYRR